MRPGAGAAAPDEPERADRNKRQEHGQGDRNVDDGWVERVWNQGLHATILFLGWPQACAGENAPVSDT